MMGKTYSQTKAMFAITRASLRAIFRSPSAVIFSFVFPLIFILVFGFLGSGGRVNIKVAFDNNTDTSGILYKKLKNVDGLIIVQKSSDSLNDDLVKGRLAAIISISKNKVVPGIDTTSFTTPFSITLRSSEAVNPQQVAVLRNIIQGVISEVNAGIYPKAPEFAEINEKVERVEGRKYKTIDFILPGQLGFSLLSAGVFGVAFIFFNLRQTLVLKRFFATPIRRSHILFGEAISRVLFQIITAVVILLVGHYAFGFTLVYGFITFLELVVLSLIGLVVFMGFGFVVSGLAKNESAIPPFANLITLPQFLLAGTFFSIEAFPEWLQPFCYALPLTHLNNAMRNVAFEGAHIADCGVELAWLGGWCILVYALAVKFFKWE